jgi:hypothetical protein
MERTAQKRAATTACVRQDEDVREKAMTNREYSSYPHHCTTEETVLSSATMTASEKLDEGLQAKKPRSAESSSRFRPYRTTEHRAIPSRQETGLGLTRTC